jgi:hypothetical protein
VVFREASGEVFICIRSMTLRMLASLFISSVDRNDARDAEIPQPEDPAGSLKVLEFA